jgi:hypothetical protein
MWEKEQLLMISVTKEGYRETLIASLQSSLVISWPSSGVSSCCVGDWTTVGRNG